MKIFFHARMSRSRLVRIREEKWTNFESGQSSLTLFANILDRVCRASTKDELTRRNVPCSVVSNAVASDRRASTTILRVSMYLHQVMTRGHRLSVVGFGVALVCLAQCRRREIVRSDATPPAATERARAAPEPRDAPPAVADAASDAESPLEPSQGRWLEGNIYQFRVDEIRRCTPPAFVGFVRVGVLVRVASKMDELLVAPRDVKLEAGGVILESTVLPSAPGGCAPILAPKSLRAGKSAAGVVVFDLPAGFNAEHRPLKVTYQPTRWGGARRVEAVLPPESVSR